MHLTDSPIFNYVSNTQMIIEQPDLVIAIFQTIPQSYSIRFQSIRHITTTEILDLGRCAGHGHLDDVHDHHHHLLEEKKNLPNKMGDMIRWGLQYLVMI